MSKRRLQAIDLIHVFTDDDWNDELYDDGSRPSRDPNLPPKIFFSTQHPVKKVCNDNSLFGRAVVQAYTSDSSTDFETTDEDEDDNDTRQTEGHLGTSHSDDGGTMQNDDQSSSYCKCPVTARPVIADDDEPDGSMDATTNKINDLTLNDRRCSNCMMYKQENSEPFPIKRLKQERRRVVVSIKRPRKKKRRKIQIVRKITGYILEPGLPSSSNDFNS